MAPNDIFFLFLFESIVLFVPKLETSSAERPLDLVKRPCSGHLWFRTPQQRVL